ncbi:MAG: phage BR0599 family protein, partial [Planktotalea sp.]|uniref:phage BR0599 family protein n=1 Tax=Planktotalea sp. TaxID=2029877 RepID=UPI003C72562F
DSYRAERAVVETENARVFRFNDLEGFGVDWFERGKLEILSGDAQGLSAAIKVDRTVGSLREVTLWEPLRARVIVGDEVRLFAGCDKRFETCRVKFSNVLNFRGFPDIPEEEWMMVHPSKAPARDGGSRR